MSWVRIRDGWGDGLEVYGWVALVDVVVTGGAMRCRVIRAYLKSDYLFRLNFVCARKDSSMIERTSQGGRKEVWINYPMISIVPISYTHISHSQFTLLLCRNTT